VKIVHVDIIQMLENNADNVQQDTYQTLEQIATLANLDTNHIFKEVIYADVLDVQEVNIHQTVNTAYPAQKHNTPLLVQMHVSIVLADTKPTELKVDVTHVMPTNTPLKEDTV